MHGGSDCSILIVVSVVVAVVVAVAVAVAVVGAVASVVVVTMESLTKSDRLQQHPQFQC